jgi:hypothetical protein
VTITFRPAKRESVGLLIGLAGASGSGKTYSALKLATGLSDGKPFAVVDTENGRALHYADAFSFHHALLSAPFRPEAYADAIQAADEAGFPVIVVDSASHEHAGDGGLLDWHEEEFQRMGGRDQAKMAAWIKPKMAHRKMVSRLLQVRAHVILCFRAQESIEIVKDPKTGKTEIRPKKTLTGLDGWVPIAEKTLPYELTVSFLLAPDKPGVPRPIKLQEQHRAMIPLDEPLTEETGRRLAEWARGDASPTSAPTAPEPGTDAQPELPAYSIPAAVSAERLRALATELGILERTEAAITRNLAQTTEPQKHAAWLEQQVKRMEEAIADRAGTAA